MSSQCFWTYIAPPAAFLSLHPFPLHFSFLSPLSHFIMLREALLTVPQADSLFTPPSSYSPQKTLSRLDLRLDSPSDDSLDADIFNMAGTASPTPYIKEEVDDLNPFNNNRYLHHGFEMNQPFGHQQFSAAQDSMGAINPTDLNMGSGSHMNQFSSSSYLPGGASLADDELADSLGLMDQPSNMYLGDNLDHQDNFFQGNINGNAASHHPSMQIYSNTPDDLPIVSPFQQPHHFDFSQYQSTPQRMAYPQSLPSGAIPRQKIPAAMNRNGAEGRSPMSPKAPAIGNLHLGTPDSGSFPTQPIMANMQRRQKSGQWDHTPGSAHSWLESPTQSPHGASMQHQHLAEVIHSKHASLPAAKVDMGQTQDAKKRRRRESHNLVERRRRDNINERIHDLSRLVPGHRLEDEKIRKHINNNGPLSPTLATSGMSPPQATSLLAGGTGKRAAGNITTGLPLEDKDKGPNKGDILNGAVSWTRDLMWLCYKKIQEADEMAARLRQATGEEWPVDETEEERRMRTELVEAVEKNGAASFKYSRGPGSGLRVPKHTTLAGEPIGQISPQSLSPGMQSNGSGSNSNSNGNNPQFWMNQQPNGFSLKEEEEYNMDMG